MSKASEKLKAMAEERGLTRQPVERKVVQLGVTRKVTERRPARKLGQAVVGQRMQAFIDGTGPRVRIVTVEGGKVTEAEFAERVAASPPPVVGDGEREDGR